MQNKTEIPSQEWGDKEIRTLRYQLSKKGIPVYFFLHTSQKTVLVGNCIGQKTVLTWAVITEYHGLGGLNNRDLFLTVLQAGKSKIKVVANSIPGERSLSDFFLAFRQPLFFVVYSHALSSRVCVCVCVCLCVCVCVCVCVALSPVYKLSLRSVHGSQLCPSGPLLMRVGVGRALKEQVALGIVIHVRT